MINRDDLNSAIKCLDKADPTLWDNGMPNLQAVRNLMQNQDITAEDIAAAQPPGGGEGTKATAEPSGAVKASTETGAAPQVKASTETIAPPVKVGTETIAPPQAAAPEPAANTLPKWAVESDNREEHIGEEDRLEVMKRLAAEADAEREALKPLLDAAAQDREQIDNAIKAMKAEFDRLTKIINDNTEQVSQAEMVRRIQAQTQRRLMEQHAATAAVKETMDRAGLKTFASPLDASLAAGGKRTVALINGKPYVAPHPRSAEGVRNYASWLHNGQRPAA